MNRGEIYFYFIQDSALSPEPATLSGFWRKQHQSSYHYIKQPLPQSGGIHYLWQHQQHVYQLYVQNIDELNKRKPVVSYGMEHIIHIAVIMSGAFHKVVQQHY